MSRYIFFINSHNITSAALYISFLTSWLYPSDTVQTLDPLDSKAAFESFQLTNILASNVGGTSIFGATDFTHFLEIKSQYLYIIHFIHFFTSNVMFC